jgi:DNA repair exonuclease SbcCD ATPase subunit
MLRDGTDDCSVCVTVEHAGETTGCGARSRRARRRATSSAVTREFDDPEIRTWEPLTLASIAETDALICQTLGLTRETFRASAFLGQGARAFASKDTTPKQRMALFSALLGLGVYEKMAARAHDERVTVEREAETVHARRADALARAAGRDEYERVAALNAETARSASEALAAAQTRRDALAEAFTQAHEKTHAVGVAQAALTAAESRAPAAARRHPRR